MIITFLAAIFAICAFGAFGLIVKNAIQNAPRVPCNYEDPSLLGCEQCKLHDCREINGK